jgi:two-component system chemotaxis sensor kinase CheA
VGVEKVDQLINLVGELVITQAMLVQKAAAHPDLANGMADLERNTRDLQEAVLSIRMLPIAFVFNRFPRMLRDLAAKLGKQVELKTIGEQTELDKGVIEKISDPMTHLVRNAVDHGIETPEARLAAGKPAQGTLTLRAFHQGGNIVIEVADDGKGLDREKLIAKAQERGLKADPSMSDQEAWQLIFEPGFSTAEKVTDVSGRGVGMDVVKKNITALGGAVELDSAKGLGTRVTVRLPLTLAIMDGMSVGVGGEVYIVPLASVVELLEPGSREVKTVAGQGRVVDVRSEYLPVTSLADVFGAKARHNADKSAMVILESEGAKSAVLVDELLGQQQVVVKSLEANYKRVPCVSGATILGDGSVALIVDVGAVGKLTRH